MLNPVDILFMIAAAMFSAVAFPPAVAAFVTLAHV